VRFFTDALMIVFKIAAPVAVALFVTNVALGLMARVAPQMNVFVVGLPLQIGIGLIMLAVSLPLLGYVLPQLFSDVPHQLDAVLRGLAPAGAAHP
jgi:flagellar biosynthetic protein FliR